MITSTQLLPLRNHTRVVAHIPGRLRLKFSAGIFLHLRKLDFSSYQMTLDDFPALRHYRVNLAAMSVIVEYDHSIVSFALIDQLFHQNDQQALKALEDIQLALDLEEGVAT